MHEGHRDRLRDRYLNESLDSFNDHQVLELALFYAIPRRDTNEIAHSLINEFGGLRKVFDAPLEEIQRVDGMGKNSAVYIKLLADLLKRYQKSEQGIKPVINSPQKAAEIFKIELMGLPKERIMLACLDTQKRLIDLSVISEGTLDQAALYVREVVEKSLLKRAHSVIIAHNHPGGLLRPSQDDIRITKKLVAALDTVGIPLVDHIIVAGDSYVSLKESGDI